MFLEVTEEFYWMAVENFFPILLFLLLPPCPAPSVGTLGTSRSNSSVTYIEQAWSPGLGNLDLGLLVTGVCNAWPWASAALPTPFSRCAPADLEVWLTSLGSYGASGLLGWPHSPKCFKPDEPLGIMRFLL